MPTLDLSGLQILDNPGIGGNALLARTALRHYGEYYRPDGVAWVGWCEMFVGNVLAEAGIPHTRYESAILDALGAPLYRGQAPAGSLVFFDQRSSPYGHVGIALGDGTMLSALGGGVVRTTYADWTSYLGWRPYGTSAPNEPPITVQSVISATLSPDDQPLSLFTADTTSPDALFLGILDHATQVANDALHRLAPAANQGAGGASSLLMPHQMTV